MLYLGSRQFQHPVTRQFHSTISISCSTDILKRLLYAQFRYARANAFHTCRTTSRVDIPRRTACRIMWKHLYLHYFCIGPSVKEQRILQPKLFHNNCWNHLRFGRLFVLYVWMLLQIWLISYFFVGIGYPLTFEVSFVCWCRCFEVVLCDVGMQLILTTVRTMRQFSVVFMGWNKYVREYFSTMLYKYCLTRRSCNRRHLRSFLNHQPIKVLIERL